jgi:hypothetical protein
MAVPAAASYGSSGETIAVPKDATQGAGKSMTAAGFVKLGYPLLTDDVAALSVACGRFHVSPGYPRLNLWSDAVEGDMSLRYSQ